MTGREQLKPVTRDRPCDICQGTHKCGRGSDGRVMCGRPPDRLKPGDTHNGFVYLGRAKDDEQWGLFRNAEDPVIVERRREREDDFARQSARRNGASGNGTSPKPRTGPRKDMQALAADLATRLQPWHRAELANALGLPEHVLSSLPLLGFDEHDRGGPCWYFPESDGAGRVVGINRRYKDGKKKAVAGGDRGLTIPTHWQEREGPVLLPEGATDTLALTALGLPAIGRPSNRGGVKQLVELLDPLATDRDILVLAEWDTKDDGTWPGRDGAVAVAGQLANALGRPVLWALPPDRAKDVRAWVAARKPALNDSDAWSLLGSELGRLLGEKRLVVKPGDGAGLATTCLATIKPQPIEWLVPGTLPLGKLILLAGDGGHGKSSLTLALAADLSRGRPCFGLDYEPEAPCDTLLVGCEDDYGDTVVPRLLAAGADLLRIHKVDGVRDKDGKPRPFCLTHYEQMERELAKMPNVRLVVIDPAGAYVGRSGVDDHKDSELRALLDPMAELSGRRRVTITLVKHLNKGASAKAVHKVSGGAGYVNAVRAAFIVLPEENDPELKLLLPIKFNLGRKPQGLSFKLQPLEREESVRILSPFEDLKERDRERLAAQLFRVSWEGAGSWDADSLTGDHARSHDSNKVARCMEWLKTFLANFAFPDDEIKAAAKEQGFTFDNLKEAKARLREENGLHSRTRGFQGKWWNGFGDPATWTERPEPPLRANGTFEAPHSPHSPHTGEVPEEETAQIEAMMRVLPFDR